MGGFAVTIDWDRPVHPREVEAMMHPIPHRANRRNAGTRHAPRRPRRGTHNGADQGEPWTIATMGPLSIVGDIRLFDTDRLRSAAGGRHVTEGFDHRQLLLAAYRRHGPDMLDTVDGDFAFVIWDEAKRQVLAVRDRFAVKPIFYEETADRYPVRLGGQAAGVHSEGPITPDLPVPG